MPTPAGKNLRLLITGIAFGIVGIFSSSAQTLGEALGATNLVWTTGGDAAWFTQTTNTYDGIDAVRSGTVYSNQTSWLETTVVGPATVSFWSYAQSPSGGISFGWRFAINTPNPPSGLSPLSPFPSFWNEQIYDLGAGTNVLRWTTFGHAAGSEAGFLCVDEFTVLPPRPLSIVSEPMDLTVYSGEDAWAGVSAVGTPPLQYQWLKNGTNIVNATNAWVAIYPATTNDTGVYAVTVSSAQGQVTSSNVLLTILPPTAPFFTKEPASVTAYTGQSYQWWPGVDGSPPFSFEWVKDETNLVQSGNFDGMGFGSFALVLTNISESDAGVYRLCVTNDYGGIESTDAVLTVVDSVAPVITRQPRSVDVAEGADTWMSVLATGVPAPWDIWTKEGAPPPSPPGLPILTSNQRHLLNNVTTNDAGIYFATVSNYAGGVFSQGALLTVLPPIAQVGTNADDAVGIFVTNSLAFLARGTNGVAILDVSHPASPQPLGSYGTPGYASAVRASGKLAFVANGSAGLQILSFTNPANPTLVASFDTPGTAQDLAVQSNLVYLADGHGGLLIVNVSNPASPSLVGSYLTNFSPAHICLSGNLACLTSLQPAQIIGGSNYWVGGMLIVDVSDPAQPTKVARWGGSLDTVAGRDDLIFSGTAVISMTNPVQPVEIGDLSYYSTNLPFRFTLEDFQVVNDLLYSLAPMDGLMHLFVFNVRDPSNPVPVGCHAVGNGKGTLWVDGHYVYLAGYDSPLEILQTPFNTNPVAAPVLSASAQTGVQLRIQGWHGLHYDVEYTGQLPAAQWQSLQTLLLTNDSAVIPIPTHSAAGFFRLKQLD